MEYGASSTLTAVPSPGVHKNFHFHVAKLFLMIRISLSQDSFKLGRAKTSDYVIRESDMGSSRWLTAVSKCQCEIIKNDKGVFLKDRSSNGENLTMNIYN